MSSIKGAVIPLVLMIVAATSRPSAARADLVTNLDVSFTALVDGNVLYNYTLTNEPTSTVAVSSFFLAVGNNADLTSLTGPDGWDLEYDSLDNAVMFTSPAADFDIAVGSVGLFSFVSPLGPVSASYLIRAFADDGSIVETTGFTLTPGAAVPEPASLAMLAMGALGLSAAAARRRRRLEVPARP